MTKVFLCVLAVFFLLLSLSFMQRIGAVPVEPDELEEKRQWENELWEPDTDKTIDEIILESFGGLEAEKAAEESRLKEEGLETEGMDTLLTPEQAAMLHNTPEGGMSKRRLPTFVTLWPGGVVPYDLSGLSPNHHNRMMEAFREWERNTCVSFVPAQRSHPSRLVFINNDGCSSLLGMAWLGEQPISLAPPCHSKKIYLHELGHALGLVHEHQLPQRRRYIRVRFRNVIPGYRRQLRRYKRRLIPNAQQVAYNYRSIMHYGKYAFSRGPGLQTIFARNRGMEEVMGTSEELVPSDIQVVNLLYNCNSGN